MYSDIKKLWNHLTVRRHWQFVITIFFMVIASFAEMISIGAVLPFLGVLTDPDAVYQYKYAQPFIELLKIETHEHLMSLVTILFITAAITSATIRITLLYVVTRLSFVTGSDISVSMYEKTLYQQYSVHITRNSSEIINSIVQKSNLVIHEVINSLLVLISSVFMIVGIVLVLFMINIQIALYSIISFSIIYWLIVQYTKEKLNSNSNKIAQESTNTIKALQEGLGGIRDVLIDGSQKVYCEIYRKADLQLRLATGVNRFIAMSPRYLIESVGMILIAVLAYFLSQHENGIIDAIPVLGALALGAQRLLPVSQQVYASVSAIIGARSSFQDVLKLLDQKIPDYVGAILPPPIPFNKDIVLHDISFKYSDSSKLVLNDLNIKIIKGSKTGLIGQTGCGKSTILDILMGLLQPVQGGILIDGHKLEKEDYLGWQRHIAHVPQFIYLSDGTIEENIVLGTAKKEINYERLNLAVRRAQLSNLIESWDDKYQTIVGEQGVKLSGGQRQRIGIARALYKEADLLILDEATSALDDKTEKKIMDSINNVDKSITVIIIAHRLTTLKECDQIIEVKRDNVVREVSYDQLMRAS